LKIENQIKQNNECSTGSIKEEFYVRRLHVGYSDGNTNSKTIEKEPSSKIYWTVIV
jgi:hypothetical protein